MTIIETIESPHAPVDDFVETRSWPVAFHDCGATARRPGHDLLTKMAIARGLAKLLGVEYLGTLGACELVGQPALVVPSDTLPSLAHAHRLGIDRPARLFGGVVPRAHVATKVITHPLVRAGAVAPEGWSGTFGECVRSVVLRGCSAFSLADATQAGEALLDDGAVRLKAPGGVGGAGQHVVRDRAELRRHLDSVGDAALRTDGIVLERNLSEVVTHSVGQVQVGPWLASYVGRQRLVCNHHGHQVYGGSDLRVVRGDYQALIALQLEPVQRHAIEQALVFHRSALACFEGMVATRSNYDVVQGVDEAGNACMGVLEQSWRIGGASGAELLALCAFKANPALQSVRASTHELYDARAAVPAGAFVVFDGLDDSGTGRLTKYAVVERDDQLA
jgi:hypothetical protein